MSRRIIGKIVKFMKTDIWQIQSDDTSPLGYLCLEILKKIILAVRFFTAKRVVTEAAALTYSTMLAIVPILAVVFAVARGFGYNKYIEIWFLDAFRSQPQAAEVIVGFVNSYLIHTRSGVFLGIGLAFMLYTVLMLVSNIERTFNNIWQVKKPRSIFRTFTDYLAMLFMFPIVIVLTSGISIFIATLSVSLPDITLLTPAVKMLIKLTPYILMSGLFIGLYVFMPNTHVKISACMVPGILAGIAMQWLQLFYIHSQIWVSSYNAIYGSFAALPLFMLWVQISWTICLFGAELCYTNQRLDYYAYDTTTADISHRYRIMLCAIMLACLSKRFEQVKKPYTASDLRDKTGIPIRIVNDLLFRMIESNLVIEISSDEKGESSRYVPAESPHTLSLGTMIDRLEANGRWRIDLQLRNIDDKIMRKSLELRSRYLHDTKEILIKDLWSEDGAEEHLDSNDTK